MSNTRRYQKWRRRLLIILSIIIVVIASISIMADRIVDGIIRNTIDDAEATFYGITYRLEVGEINTDLLSRSVALHHVQFLPLDTALLDQKTDTVQMMIRFDELKMVDLDIRQLYDGDSLDIGSIELKNAEIDIFIDLDQLDPSDIQFIPNVKEIFARNNIGRIDADNALVNLKVVERKDTHRTFIEPMDLLIEKPRTLPIDSIGRAQFYFDHFELQADKMLIDLENSYRIQTGTFSINSSDSAIHISELDLRPKKGTPKVENGEIRTIDWSTITASDLQVTGFEMLDLMHNDGFQADLVRIKDPHLSMYQSFFVMDSLEDLQAKMLPGTRINEMKGRFSVAHLEFDNGLIEYEEVYDTIAEPIYFAVRDMKLVLKNFTPRKDLLAKNDILEIEFGALILDSVRVRSRLKIPVLSPNARFDLIGHVDALDLTMFNPIMETQRMKFKSGYLNNLDIDLSADLSRSIGTLDMDYTNLHMRVLKRDKVLPVRLTQHNMLVSFLFNKIIKTNNSKEQKNYRQGVIDVQRDPSTDLMTYILESTFAGVISSMTGIDDSMSNRFPEIEITKSKKELRREKKQNKKERKKKK